MLPPCTLPSELQGWTWVMDLGKSGPWPPQIAHSKDRSHESWNKNSVWGTICSMILGFHFTPIPWTPISRVSKNITRNLPTEGHYTMIELEASENSKRHLEKIRVSPTFPWDWTTLWAPYASLCSPRTPLAGPWPWSWLLSLRTKAHPKLTCHRFLPL
jgi:hypothetical protein